MNVRGKTRSKSLQFAGLGLAASLLMVGGSVTAQTDSSIKIDGSSTVYPITQKIVEDYRSNKNNQQILK